VATVALLAYGGPTSLERLVEAPGRLPAPRARADLTHNPERSTEYGRKQHILEHRAWEIDLP
jgi:hypothetical protein